MKRVSRKVIFSVAQGVLYFSKHFQTWNHRDRSANQRLTLDYVFSKTHQNTARYLGLNGSERVRSQVSFQTEGKWAGVVTARPLTWHPGDARFARVNIEDERLLM